MRPMIVRADGSGGKWTMVNAESVDAAARIAAGRRKAQQKAKRSLVMPRAWNVAELRTDAVLGEVSGNLGCVCEGAATLYKMFNVDAAVTVRL